MIIVPGQAVGLIGDGGNNEVATFTDDRHIQGEANLTFDGSTLTVTGALTVGVDDTGHDVKFFGATASRYMLWDESEDYLIFPDNVKAVFGTGGDLSIYHDSNHSYISDQGTGNIAILANDFQVNNAANNANMISATQGGAVALNHNGSTKLATHASGVEITGSLEVATIDFTDGDNAMTIVDNGGVTFNGYNNASTRDVAKFKSTRTTGDATYLRIGRYGTADDGTMNIGNNFNRDSGFAADNTSLGVSAIQFNSDGTIDLQTGAAGSAQPTDRVTISTDADVTLTGSLEVATIDYTDGDLAMTIANGGGVTFAQNVTMDANLDMEGYSVFGNGSGLDPSYTLTVDRAFSDTSQAVSLRVRGTITSTDGTGTLAGFQVQPAGTVINSGNAHNVYSAWFIEPAITETSGSVTTAATVYIQNAPTEADSNYALFVDAGASRFDGATQFGVNDVGVDVTFFGATSGRDMMWDQAANRLEFKDNTYMSFGTGVDTQMYHTGSAFYTVTETFYNYSAASFRPIMQLINGNSDNGSSYFDFVKQSDSPHVDDYLGLMRFIGRNDADESTVATTLFCNMDDLSDGSEDGSWTFQVMINGGSGGALTTIMHTTAAVIAGDFNDTSDVMLKDNIEDIDTAIDTVKQLRPVTFDWKVDDREASGFIAQEVEKIIPNIVTGIDATEDGDRTEHKSIKTIGLVAQITKALQESIEKIETLEAQVKELQEA